MSYVVKGYKFPQSCRECWLVYPEGLHNCSCILTDKYWEFEEEMPSKSRLPECPLVEIPTPHGRLIDADKLQTAIHGCLCETCQTFPCEKGIGCLIEDVFNLIDQAPIIVEAEVSE